MSKCLRKYNKSTEKWEIISPASSDYIAVSNTNFNNEGSSLNTLTDVLNNIGNDINKLKRNVSWLAEHGGGGGIGGGGGAAVAYKINVFGLTNNKLYITKSPFSFSFRIEGGTNLDIVEYQVYYDNVPFGSSTKTTANKNTDITIPRIDLNGERNQHFVEIRAVDNNGLTIPSLSFEVVEALISIDCDERFTLSMDENDRRFSVYVTNKMLNTNVVVTVTNVKDSSKTVKIEYPSNTKEPVQVPFEFKNNLINGEIYAGAQYQLQIDAQVEYEGQFYNAETKFTNIFIVSTDNIVVTFNGVCSENDYNEDNNNISEYATNGSLKFSFTPYLKNENNLYYAVRLKSFDGTKIIKIKGDETFSDEQYNLNNYCTPGTSVAINEYLNNDSYIGEWYIEVKCWKSNGSIPKIARAVCHIVKGVNVAFDMQIPKRSQNSIEGDTCYANWDINNLPKEGNWVSEIENYLKPGAFNINESERVIMEIVPHNINGNENGFIDGERCLRLTNKAYATVDINNETITNWLNQDGFTLSITFKSDFHPYNNRTIFMWGDVDSNGDFKNGIKIDLEYIYWYLSDTKGTDPFSLEMKVPIQQNVLNTVDFVYEHKESSGIKHEGIAKIFINGKLYNAVECNYYYTGSTFSNTIYLGCGIDENDETVDYSDVNIYSLSIFSKYLNDLQMIVNSHNSRAKRDADGQINIANYTEWKKRNFFRTTDDGSVDNTLFEIANGKYTNVNYYDFKTTDSPLPVLYLDCRNSEFTSDIYYNIYTESDNATGTTYGNVQLQYYDPEKDIEITTTVSISLQGTSTTGLRSKNLELYFTKVINEATQDVELFQPKDDWFPESQFTLKADVVDSAHANNTTIGKWINTIAVEQGILEDTPPMKVVSNNPPKDAYVNESGVKVDTGESHNIKVKHALEGFPIILLITFGGSDTTEMLGMYSFNLGRYSYYNMGMSFLKSFSRRKYNIGTDTYDDNGTPALIKDYEYYERTKTIGDDTEQIKLSDIYSYEFGAGADVNEVEHPTWSQDGVSALQLYGKFNFNGSSGGNTDVDNTTWNRLKLIFEQTARINPVSHMYNYVASEKIWVKEANAYFPDDGGASEKLCKYLSIKNAMAYFVIANAFGMVDSLGKNLTLRTWNINDDDMMWYPCFYDMDTALGITNEGAESVPSTAFIDEYKNRVINEGDTGTNSLIVTRNKQIPGGFVAYNSKLWNILRATTEEGSANIFKSTGHYKGDYYEDVWKKLRQVGGNLRDVNNIINMLTEQTQECGEILFNYDYNIKYLTKYDVKDENGNITSSNTFGNIGMLHGDRVEYIRKWLTDRFIFLDCVFENTVADNGLPYYNNGQIVMGGNNGEDFVSELIFNVTSPAILKLTVGSNMETTQKYFLPAYEGTRIITPPVTSTKRLGFNLMSIMTEIDGIQNNNFSKFENCKFPKFSKLDLSGVNTLDLSSPIDFQSTFVFNNASELRELDLSNATSQDANASLSVDLTNFNKLSEIDISNSCVGALILPKSPMSKLLFSNSKVKNLTIEDQPYLENLDFRGCKSLSGVTIINCSKITNLDISNLSELSNVIIRNCNSLTKIQCKNNPKLKTIVIENNAILNEIDLSGCSNKDLKISILTCDNLSNINLSSLQTTQPIGLPNTVNNVTKLTLTSCVGLTAFVYGSGETCTYQEENVLDLTPFTNLPNTGLNLTNCSALKYVKFKNDENASFDLTSDYFSKCTSLRQIFGRVKIKGTGVFSGCSNFSIHNDVAKYTTLPENIVHEEGDFVTNMIVDTTSLSSCFSNTNCSLSDAYYILRQCEKVSNLSSLFYECKNVRNDDDHSLDRNIFKYCGNVTNMSSLFYSCNLRGFLRSPKDGEYGILSYCKSLTNFNTTFYPATNFYIDENFFCENTDGEPLKITSISYFSPKTIADSNSNNTTVTYIKTTKLLANLPNLTTITNSFNQGQFEFITNNNDGTPYCDLFYNNTKLVTIDDCFNGITATGTCRNLFGGYDGTLTDKSHFPQSLTTIKSSFIVNTGNLKFYIGNSFLQKIKNSIKYITGANTGNYTSTTSSFNGNGMYKYIDVEPGFDEYAFPYKIFNGCSNLLETPALLRNLRRENETFENDVIQIPIYKDAMGDYVSMFKDTPKITNISYLFSNMYGIKYELVGGGFKNTSLKNVEGVFAESTSENNKEGMIPYGLFYQEKRANWNENGSLGITEEVADSLGILNEGYGIENYTGTTGVKPNLVWGQDGKISNNKTLPDGVMLQYELDEYGRVTDILATDKNTFIYPTGYTETYSGSYVTCNPTITNMANFMANSRGEDIIPYTYNITPEEINYNIETKTYDCGELVIDNPNYNPIKFFINQNYNPHIYKEDDEGNEILNNQYDPRRVIYNKNFDPYKKMWNKWVCDGSDVIKQAIEDSQLYNLVSNGTLKELPNDLSAFDGVSQNLPNEGDIYSYSNEWDSGNYLGNFQIRRYFTAPDIFRYCTNSCNITRAFYNCGGTDRTEDIPECNHIKFGVKGVIPSFIFEPVKATNSLSEVFYYCNSILPYVWKNGNEDGVMYPSTLFSGMTSLTNISKMFAYHNIYKNCYLPSNLFITNTNLSNLSGLFYDAHWKDNSNQQIPTSLFSKNRAITDVSEMLCRSSENQESNSTPSIMNKDLFVKNIHSKITNCEKFMYCCGRASGTVPEFWNFGLTKFSGCYYGINQENINNEVDSRYQ